MTWPNQNVLSRDFCGGVRHRPTMTPVFVLQTTQAAPAIGLRHAPRRSSSTIRWWSSSTASPARCSDRRAPPTAACATTAWVSCERTTTPWHLPAINNESRVSGGYSKHQLRTLIQDWFERHAFPKFMYSWDWWWWRRGLLIFRAIRPSLSLGGELRGEAQLPFLLHLHRVALLPDGVHLWLCDHASSAE